jgi:hypothetical protein
MEGDPNFLAPGGDGELDPGRSLWRKGLVYTTRTGVAHRSTAQNYPFGQKTRRTSSIVFEVEIIGPPLSNSTIAGVRNGRPEYKLAHDA